MATSHNTPEIRGTATAKKRMLLGKVRKVFKPLWIQSFESGGAYSICIGLESDTDSSPLIRFMEMNGYTVSEVSHRTWETLYFTESEE